MRIQVEGRQPLRGTYKVSGNSNSAVVLIAASMLGDSQVTLNNVPDTASVRIMLEVGQSLGLTYTRDDHQVVLNAAKLEGRGLEREHTDASSGTLLFLAPILARRHHARIVIDYAISRVQTHLTAMQDLGIHVTVDGGVIDLEAKPWQEAEIILTQTSVTATSLVCMLAVCLGQRTVVANAASEPHVVDLLNMLVAMGAQIDGIDSHLATVLG